VVTKVVHRKKVPRTAREPATAEQAGKIAKPANMFQDMLRLIRRVPRGKVATYGDIAYAAGYPGAARQVAWALHQGHKDVPWQRIVGAGGTILCTGELGLEQRMRLNSEGVGFIGLKVDMAKHRHSFFAKQKLKS
jgi:methylated-DNA-protein-cysteine methyltransferase related protein